MIERPLAMAAAVASLFVIAGCEAMRQPRDGELPNLVVTESGVSGYILATDPDLSPRERPRGCDGRIDIVPVGDVLHVVQSFPTRIGIIATDRSGIRAIRVTFAADWTATDLSESARTRIIEGTHGGGATRARLVAIDFDELRTLRELRFTLDQEDGQASVGFAHLHITATDGSGLDRQSTVTLAGRDRCRR